MIDERSLYARKTIAAGEAVCMPRLFFMLFLGKRAVCASGQTGLSEPSSN